MGILSRALAILSGKLEPTDERRTIQGDAVNTVLAGSPGVGKTIATPKVVFSRTTSGGFS